jgi:hemolysin III
LQLAAVYRVLINMSLTKQNAAPLYTISEEIANSVLHGIGVLGAITGLVMFSLKSRGIFGGGKAASTDRIAVIIFAATMIAMFLISTLYHAIQHQGAKRIFRKLDHSVIYIFIAGTYTPFCLSGLGGAWGWSIFTFEWSLAMLGIVLHVLGIKIYKKIEIAIYLLMGWAIVAGFVPLIRSVSVQCIVLLFAGGLAYTMGAVCYRMKSIKYNHVIWHVFVVAGTICHWFAVWNLY